MTCPQCRRENPPQAKFCQECATSLALRCSNCGTQLVASAKFCFECAHPVGGIPAPPRFAAPGSYTPKHLAERDPEEARKLLDPVLERMMEAVHRYEGTVNQVMGDGIMALFGAPLA